jgi:Adenovirus endoprotease
MNTIEINSIISKDPVLSKIYLGTFASDQLPFQVFKYPCALIVNTDPSYKPGRHWVALYFDSDRHCDFFDSFGFYPITPSVLTFITNNSIKLRYNNMKLQSVCSTVCGLYCIQFLYRRCRYIFIPQQLKSFDRINHSFNDASVCRFIYKTFNVRHSTCKNAQSCLPMYMWS